MILLELLNYLYENKKQLSLGAIIIFVGRWLVVKELERLFHLQKEKEIEWIRKKLEEVTGETFSLQNPFSKTVRTHYIELFTKLFAVPMKLVKLLRRKNMNKNINWYTLIISLLGALKLILEPFGIVIPGENFNDIANGAAGLAALIGVFLSHKKAEVQDAQHTNVTGTNK